MKHSLLKTKIEIIISNHPEITTFGRIDCLGDAEKAIDGILTAKGYDLVKVERCDGPGCQSTYLVEAKDTRGIVVTVGYLDGYTHDSLWQKLVNKVAEYMDEI